MIFYKIQNSLILNLEKAQNEGIYVDNYKNRKLGVVGQSYMKKQILKDEKELSLIKRKIFQGENYLKFLDNKIEKARRIDNLEEADRLDLVKLDTKFSLDNFKKDYIILEEKIEKYKKEHPAKIKNKEEELKTSIITDTYESATEKLGRHARKNEYGGKLSSAGKELRNLDGKEY